jgi:uncharacterized protein (TIGR00725 family)
MRLAIGVMGSSGGGASEAVLAKAYRLGETIAARDAVLVTGRRPGLPHAPVRGAKAKGGLVIGISPGRSLDEHRGKSRLPVEGFDVLVYTGSGLMGREIASIRSCDMVVIAGGGPARSASSRSPRGLTDVLTGTGGMTEIVERILETAGKDPGTCVRYDEESERLVDRRTHYYRAERVPKPSCFGAAGPEGAVAQ